MLKAIIFDFDGVIAESVDVKTKAFKELFKDFPDSVGNIEKFHLENGGMSRFDKFRHIYKNILKKDLSEAELNRLCVEFNRLVIEDVVKAPFVKGVEAFLDTHKGVYPLYIVSATPQAEMREIAARKKIDKFFKAIYGSPVSKAELIKQIISEGKFEAKNTLFIGDSKNDCHAAKETGVLFVARSADRSGEWLKSENVIFIFSEFKELKEFITRRLA
jgi:HAD superfamily hydrolase (TIGR01549 family)